MNSKNFSLAAKAFIVDKNRLLIVKRSNYTIMKPGIWEIPGGRLNPGEDMIQGLKRETKEETNIDIEVVRAISMRDFIRDDDQTIKLTIFLCRPLNKEVKLSNEHTEFEWIDIDKAKEKINEFFHKEIDFVKNHLITD